VRGVGQYELKIAVGEDVPDRLPVDAGGLHGDVGDLLGRQPD